jgi:hypothetical protein
MEIIVELTDTLTIRLGTIRLGVGMEPRIAQCDAIPDEDKKQYARVFVQTAADRGSHPEPVPRPDGRPRSNMVHLEIESGREEGPSAHPNKIYRAEHSIGWPGQAINDTIAFYEGTGEAEEWKAPPSVEDQRETARKKSRRDRHARSLRPGDKKQHDEARRKLPG